MKAFGISDKFLKGRPFKQDHVRGRLKKEGRQNWWEEIAENINKTASRMKAKLKIKIITNMSYEYPTYTMHLLSNMMRFNPISHRVKSHRYAYSKLLSSSSNSIINSSMCSSACANLVFRSFCSFMSLSKSSLWLAS